MARRLIGGPCAALLTAGIAIVAVPQALGAGVRTAPAASGSLERTDRDCSTDREMDLLTTYCDYSYFTASGFADDPKTYLVDWVQIAVQPRRGWCLANAHGFMRQPGSSVGAWIPKPPATAGLNSMRLSVTSRGRSLGNVKQQFRLSHGVTSATVKRHSGGDRYSWHWQGRSRDKVLIEVGVEFARPPSGDEIYVTEQGSVVKSVQC
jgi:hypothetical protein